MTFQVETLLHKLDQYDAGSRGVDVEDVLGLPEPFSVVFAHLIRKRKMSESELGEEFGLTAVEYQQLNQALVEKGFLRQVTNRRGETFYRLKIASKAKSYVPDSLWQQLDD